MIFRAITDIEWSGKIALLRADFNVPLHHGVITDDTRIRAALPSILHVLNNGGGVAGMSHLGRPQAGVFDGALSLLPVAVRLSELLNKKVIFQKTLPQHKPMAGEIWLLENTRFNPGEKENDWELAKHYAKLGDVFVMDAFASAHRAEASTCALAHVAAAVCSGCLLDKELTALSRVMKNPPRPLAAVVGGGKVSSKFNLLSGLLPQCDYLIVGGGIANTFLAAQGVNIGASLAESDMLSAARDFLTAHGDKLIFPVDVIVAEAIAETAKTRTLSVTQLSEIKDSERILDVGENTRARHAALLRECRTIIWNGPLGVFECEPFAGGTRALAAAVADAAAYSLAGGGDTLAAVKKFNVSEKISYLSTGGGALLELLAGGELPALQALAGRC